VTEPKAVPSPAAIFRKTSWSNLSQPFNYTNRNKRTKRIGNGRSVSIERVGSGLIRD